MFIIGILIVSCSNSDDKQKQTLGDHLKSELDYNEIHPTVVEPTNLITNDFLNLGVTDIHVSNNDNILTYHFETVKTFFLAGEEINLNSTLISYSAGKFYYEDDPNGLSVSFSNNVPIVSFNNVPYEGDQEHLYETKDVPILYFVVKELTTPSNLKKASVILIQEAEMMACGFMNMYYVYGVGGNSSASKLDLYRESYRYAERMKGCKLVGVPATSCLWGEHICVTSQAYCC